MDVGNPSNMERMRSLLPDINAIRSAASACSVTDAEIFSRIRTDYARYGRVWCPHTAVCGRGVRAFCRLSGARRADGFLAATAHPAKIPAKSWSR